MSEFPGDEVVTRRGDVNQPIHDFLVDREPIYRELCELREQGWKSRSGDAHFKKQRKAADEADDKTRQIFFNMMRQIGREMDDATGAISRLNGEKDPPKVLDLCMAPGGYSATVLRLCPTAEIRGVSLPLSQGGHKLLLGKSNPRLKVAFTDITMHISDMGTTDISPDHPDVENFSRSRLFASETFDLVFCDGQVLRTHPRQSYREQVEASRLTLSQLVLALQRIKHRGSLIILLHKLDTWDSLELVHTFSRFSHVQLFKPPKKHAIRSSFYLVAREINPHAPSAVDAVRVWKESWACATFRFCREDPPSEDVVRSVLAEFGEKFVELGRPIWSIQAEALRGAKFTKHKPI